MPPLIPHAPTACLLYTSIPGFRAGKVPESVVRRRYADGIRKDVIDGLLPERFNKAVEMCIRDSYPKRAIRNCAASPQF